MTKIFLLLVRALPEVDFNESPLLNVLIDFCLKWGKIKYNFTCYFAPHKWPVAKFYIQNVSTDRTESSVWTESRDASLRPVILVNEEYICSALIVHSQAHSFNEE